MNRSKVKGTLWETEITNYLRRRGVTHAERRALSGNADRGDIAGIPGLVIEAKNAQKHDLAGWLNEAERERRTDGAALGVVWLKRAGRLSAANGYVIMSGDAFVDLLTVAGYITPPPLPPALVTPVTYYIDHPPEPPPALPEAG